MHLVSGSNFPDTDLVISVTSIESRTISRPGKRDTLGMVSALGDGELGLEVVDNGLAVQVPDLDRGGSGRAEPVTVGAEDEGMDEIAGLEGVQVLGGLEVPEHDSGVLATRSTESTIRRDSNGVAVSSMSNVVNGELRSGSVQVPNLDELVPTSSNDHGLLWVRREADTGDPLRVARGRRITTRRGSEVTHQVTTSVPDLNGLVTGSRDNETVVRRERDRHDIIIVANETSLGLTSGKIPETHSLIPRGSEGETTISRQSNVLDEVVVAVKRALGDTIVLRGTSKFPDNSTLIYKNILINCS